MTILETLDAMKSTMTVDQLASAQHLSKTAMIYDLVRSNSIPHTGSRCCVFDSKEIANWLGAVRFPAFDL